MSRLPTALSGQTAFVSASTRGPARKVAECWGRKGAKVALHYRHNRTVAEESFRRYKAEGGKGLLVRADLSDEAQLEMLSESLQREMGGLDLLCLNLAMRSETAGAGDWRVALELSLKHLVSLTKDGKLPALYLLVPGAVDGAWAGEVISGAEQILGTLNLSAAYLPVNRELDGSWSGETLHLLESRL